MTVRRRTLLVAALGAPLLTAGKRPKPAVPAGWVELATTTQPRGTYIAAGTDRDLAAALAAVPAHIDRAAVRIA